jgi:hypothetical protein
VNTVRGRIFVGQVHFGKCSTMANVCKNSHFGMQARIDGLPLDQRYGCIMVRSGLPAFIVKKYMMWSA